jgi:hypothetical protein
MNVGLELLLDVTPLLETQKLIWNDIFQLQKFLTSEISKKADIYATLPNSDALSMFEIYTEA